MRSALRSAGVVAIEICAFAAVTIVMTWPTVTHLSNGISDLGDPLLTAWTLSWDVRILTSHPLQLFQANVFYPEVSTLAYGEHMLGALPIAAPVWWATHDAIVVNNVTKLVLICLGAWSAYRLALDVTKRREAAAVTGMIFGFSPWVFSHISHTITVTTYAIPAVWLFGRRVVREARVRDGLVFAASWVMVVLSSWYYAVVVSLSLVLLLGVQAIVQGRRLAWVRVGGLLAGAAAVVFVVAFVVSRPYVHLQERYPQVERSIGEAELYSPTPGALLAAPSGNHLYGHLTERFRSPVAPGEKILFPGVVATGLALVAMIGADRRRRFREVVPWVTVGVGMLLFAFGPYLPVNSYKIEFPFFHLFNWVELFRFIRAPGRAGGLMILALGVLAAMALARIDDTRRRSLICAIALVVIGVEYASMPTRFVPAPRPAKAHHYLASSRVAGAVVELPTIPIVKGEPLPRAEVGEARYVYLSTVHWRPILNGYSGFFPPSHSEMVRVMQDFPSEASIALLRERGVKFVTIHLDLLRGTPWEHLREGVHDPALRLVIDDGRVRLYELR